MKSTTVLKIINTVARDVARTTAKFVRNVKKKVYAFLYMCYNIYVIELCDFFGCD